ncbi:MAG: amidase [Gammaproteobacteria bacterium]|nr:amidase [Gammaproteobacteria bacterium]
MSTLNPLTLSGVAAGIAKGEYSALEVTQSCLDAIDRAQERLNCFISLQAEQALEEAKKADAHRASGAALGLLHGVPLAHKDMFYREGHISTCGSMIRADFKPAITATVMSRLARAGALHLGGLNMAEFATGPTGHNEHYGACRNPWNTHYITGGSSSGSGSAVAARLVFGALGSDTGGSVRLPAAACGLFGMKSTQTRISRYGVMGLSFSLDNVGPLARTARDCARLFGVIAGADPKDPTCSRYLVADYEGATREPDIRGLKIGVPKQYFYDRVTAQIKEHLDRSLAVFEDLGAVRVEVDLPLYEHLGGLGEAIFGVETLALHRAWIRERPGDYGRQTLARYLANVAIPAADYMASIHARPRVISTFVKAVFSQCDVLHCPVIPFALPTIEETDLADGPGFERLLASLTCCTRPINYLALPSLAVPIGFTANGLPVSCQLVGRPFSEAPLFRVGAAYELATNCSSAAPPSPPPTAPLSTP